ncbi:MAG: hypothetical protein V2L15_04525 [Desulfobacteraceae bacterium]|jgi:hypothetical protein|nr:hypothetical protein [Desulfobacteraceae bacterium]
MPVGLAGKRLVLTLICAAVLASLAFGPLRRAVYENRLATGVDRAAKAHIEAAMARATAAFLLARTLNAVVSVVQESRLQLNPAGVGVSLALGEALDPVNDLVERFSWVMLLSLTALGTQRVLVEISPLLGLDVLLAASMIVLMAGIWLGKWSRFDLTKAGKVLLVAALFVRFAVPAVVQFNQRVYRFVLADRHDRNVQLVQEEIERLRPVIEDGAPEVPPGDLDGGKEAPGILGRARAAIDRTVDAGRELLDLKGEVALVKAAAGGLVDRLIALTVVFVLDTVVLPIGFLWALVALLRLVLGAGFARAPERWVAQRIRPAAENAGNSFSRL